MPKNVKAKSEKQDLPRVYANPEYEKFLLGHILNGHAEAAEVFDVLKSEMFFLKPNAMIYKAMLEMREAHAELDLIAICEKLSASGDIDDCGGVAYISSLGDSLPRVLNLNNFINGIGRSWRMRRYQGFAATLGQMLEKDSMTDEKFLQAASDGLSRLMSDYDFAVDMGRAYYDAGVELLCSLDERKTIRATTGIKAIDDLTGGIHSGELAVITANTGVGKTILAQQLRRRCCEKEWHTLYCSGEMLAKHLVARDLASEARVPHMKLRTPERVTDAERFALIQAVEHLCKCCRILDGDLTLQRIRSAARAMKRKHSLELLVVDYDELVDVPGKDEWDQQRTLTRSLKSLAMELNCPAVLVSQLRKPLSGDAVFKPKLSDLYGSGSKAKHSSIVIYVDREYVRELKGEESDARMFVLKSRDGRIGQTECVFNVRTLRFEDKEGEYHPGEPMFVGRARKDVY